ncbi:MAG: FkbM family methyltransferase [Spirochaetes bacterium]|nr:FkbM family methyltransferase [Spirochaetota bacterium]
MNPFKWLEKEVRRAFTPLASRLALRLPRGPSRGYRFYGALSHLKLFKQKDAEDLFLERLNLASRTVYDIGAHVGLLTVFFSGAARAGRVLAFEPNPALFHLLEKNLRANRLSGVEALPIAVGDGPGELELSISADHPAMGSLSPWVQSGRGRSDFRLIRVPVRSLDDLGESRALPTPHFVKIDTEGFEYAVLRGMEKILATAHPALFLEMHGTPDTPQLFSLLQKHGYRVTHVETGRNITEGGDGTLRAGHLFCEAAGATLLRPPVA